MPTPDHERLHMSENTSGGASNERDPLEEFIKKMQEQGFDPSAGAGGRTGKGGKDASNASAANAQNPFGALFGEGGQNPFDINIDPEDLKNMGVSFDPSIMQAMFSQVQAMFSGAADSDSPSGINWNNVKNQTRQMLAAKGKDPSVPDNLKRAVEDAAHLADLWLDAVTAIERHNLPVQAWSKAEWVEHSFDCWREMVEPVAAEVTQSMVMPGATDGIPAEISQILNSGFLNNIGSMIFGAQMAQALAQLAGEVYSSTDVGFPLTPGSSALLPNGYQQLAENIEVPPQEVLLYLAVREAALIRLHKANPWLREDLVQLVARYARGIRVDMNRMQDAAGQIDVSNPEAVQEAFEGGMFSPQRTEDQELAVQRIEGLLALIEGWVSVVTEDATRNLPKAPQLTEIMARRRIDGGPSEQVFETLVGLEIRPRLVREAQQFWRWYESSHGFEARDGLWDTPETLPTPDELEDFAAYDARMNEISLDDVDFESELQKLLDGGFGDAPEEK